MTTITDSHPFQRTSITRRQLLTQEPEAARYLDKLESPTLSGLDKELKTRAEGASSDVELNRNLAIMAGVTGLAVGLIAAAPLIGLALGGAFGGFLGYLALESGARAQRYELDREGLNKLADKTLQGLVTTAPDGTVTDKRFFDHGEFHEPTEVRRGEEVLARSVRVELPDGQVMTASADVPRGTVTVKGPYAEGTFPGTLQLPTVREEEVRITRTDTAVDHFKTSEWSIYRNSQAVAQNLQEPDDGERIGTGHQYAHQGLGNGTIVAWNDNDTPFLIQSPLNSYLQRGDGEVTEEVRRDELWVFRKVDVPDLGPLEAVAAGELPVTRAEFQPRQSNRIKIEKDGSHLKVTNLDSTWTVPDAELGVEGEIRMGQTRQVLDGLAVHLKVGPEISVEHYRHSAPTAEAYGRKCKVKRNDDGVYVVQLPHGPLEVRAAISLEQLDAH